MVPPTLISSDWWRSTLSKKSHNLCSRTAERDEADVSLRRYPGAVIAMVLADEGTGAFLGDDLLPYLVLAMGGALVAGNLAAIFRPPPATARKEGDLDRAPVARSMVMAGIGLVAAIWALVSLLA